MYKMPFSWGVEMQAVGSFQSHACWLPEYFIFTDELLKASKYSFDHYLSDKYLQDLGFSVLKYCSIFLAGSYKDCFTEEAFLAKAFWAKKLDFAYGPRLHPAFQSQLKMHFFCTLLSSFLKSHLYSIEHHLTPLLETD